jgi:hypothetical protein
MLTLENSTLLPSLPHDWNIVSISTTIEIALAISLKIVLLRDEKATKPPHMSKKKEHWVQVQWEKKWFDF